MEPMSAWRPRWQRPPRQPGPAPLPRPVLAGLEAEFRDKPYLGSSSGESFAGGIPAPPAPLEPFRPPPPEWQEELDRGNLDLEAAAAAALAPQQQPAGELSALDALKLANGDVDELPPWRPLPQFTPMLDPALPRGGIEAPHWVQRLIEGQDP